MSRQLGVRGAPPPFALLPLALVPGDRSALHRRIAARFDAMLAAGLVDELEGLRARYELHAALPSMRCVGYRQAWSYLEGAYDRAELRDRGIFATRQLAKRQLTWLRAWAGLQTFDCLDRARRTESAGRAAVGGRGVAREAATYSPRAAPSRRGSAAPTHVSPTRRTACTPLASSLTRTGCPSASS